MDTLFDSARQPLAARMRPRTLEQFFGQDRIIGPGRLLRRAIQADQLSSLILSGPPGTGKTTLARIIAEGTRSQFISINAVLSGVKNIRDAIEQAREYNNRTNRRTILFVDEVHRWNKSQQDALLPWVEEGLVILVGATTENPWFEVNGALLSRSRVFLLEPLNKDDLERVIDAVLADRERGYGRYAVTVTADARAHLVQTASGDARTLLNALELAVETNPEGFPPPEDTPILVTLEVAEDSIQRRAVLYDKDGDYHFDTISAFIKSVRGSDPDAALYWLARMVTSGEDPRYILRRLLILAAEDVGLADPQAVTVVGACASAYDRVGMPEGQFHLAEATLYCAAAEKSNSLLGYFDALKAVQSIRSDGVPDHLKDPSRDGAALGHGQNYQYPHAFKEHWVAQQYLPEAIQGTLFYNAGELGWEGSRRSILEDRRRQLQAVEKELERTVGATGPEQTRHQRWLLRNDAATLEQMRELRRAVQPGIPSRTPLPTDRILLRGAPLQLFVWDLIETVPAGLVAVWCTDGEEYEQIQRTLSRSPLSGVEAPQVFLTPGDTVPPPGAETHPGPFEWIILRPDTAHAGPAAPLPTLSALRKLLVRTGTLSVVEVDPREGSRPSELISLPEELKTCLVAAEAEYLQELQPRWTGQQEHWTGRTTTIDVTFLRRVNPTILADWLDPETPYGGAILRHCGGEISDAIRKTATLRTAGEISWTRLYCITTLCPA